LKARPVSIADLKRFHFVGDPQVSPNGEHVAFTVKVIDAQKNRYLTNLWMADISTGGVRQFTFGDADDSSPRWSPDGNSIAFLRRQADQSQMWIIPYKGGEARQITRLPEGSVGPSDWSPDSRNIAFTFRPTHADWTKSAVGERSKSGQANPPRVITRLLYRSEGSGFLDCRRQVWKCDVVNAAATQVTFADYDVDGPVWSPDGQYLAFIADRDDKYETSPYAREIWITSPDGRESKMLSASMGFASGLSWSPDCKRVAYTGHAFEDDPWKPRHNRIWIVQVDGGGSQCLTQSLDRTVGNATLGDVREYGNNRPVWSAEGDRLFFTVSDSGNCHLYTVGLDGRQCVPLTKGNLDISGFTVDAQSENIALLVGTANQMAELYVANIGIPEPGAVNLRQISHFNDEVTAELLIQDPEEVRFESGDGTPIQGWLLKPPDFDPSNAYPLVLSIHGGPHNQYGNVFFLELRVLAAQGYVVLYCNPRGSEGYSEEFSACIRGNWGGVDYDDLIAASDFAAGLDWVDADRMAVIGGSYGGFMVNWIIGHDNRFRCAVTERTVSNMHADFGTVDLPEYADGAGYWEGNAWDNPDALWQQSPLKYVANMHTPLLIMHSEGDLRCPIHHAEQLFAALRHLRREVVFVRYPIETDHGMSRNGPPDLREDRLNRLVDWLKAHLKD